MMKIVITGGAGFIGSNLAEELAKNDDISTGRVENVGGSRVNADE